MALEDAVVLAKALRDAPDTDTALALHEALRRPRVERNITVSGQISRGGTSPSRTGRGAPAPRPGEDELIRHLEWDTGIWTVTG
jgi:2-polyprenyl-6-methoxyphenol hydroxylase-like FAD-dependent oxidoreductase